MNHSGDMVFCYVHTPQIRLKRTEGQGDIKPLWWRAPGDKGAATEIVNRRVLIFFRAAA